MKMTKEIEEFFKSGNNRTHGKGIYGLEIKTANRYRTR